MGFFDDVSDFFGGIVQGIGSFFSSPSNVTAMTSVGNTIDRINADFALEQARQSFQVDVENARLNVSRQNTLDQIVANFELEASRQLAQRQNLVARIEADFQLEAMREQFQHQMEIRRQEFEVKKLQAQFLNQYNLQKDAQAFQAELAQVNFERSIQLANLNHDNALKLQKFREEWENLRLVNRLEFEARLFEERKKLEWELKQYERETEIILANINLKNTLQSSEYTKIVDNHPLVVQTTPTLDFYKQYQDNHIPIPPLVILSPPALEFEQFPHASQFFDKIEVKLTDEVRDFLSDHYPLHDPVRPAKFLGHAYKTKRMSGEAAIEILFWTHRSIPLLLIESKMDGDAIRLYVATWNAMDSKPYYRKVLFLPWKEIVYPLARKNARSWQTVREQLVAEGKTLKEIEEEGGDDEYNLKQLLTEERDKQRGVERQRDYEINGTEYTRELADFLGFCHCILSGLLLDAYYILNYRVPPKLPKLLPNLLDNIPEKSKEQLVEVIVGNYRLLYRTLETQLPDWIPDLALDLALSLSQLENQRFTHEQVLYSVIAFLRLKRGNNLQVIDNIEWLKDTLVSSDEDYFEKLDYILSLTDKQAVPEAEKLLEAWFRLVREGHIKRKKYGNTLHSH